MFLGSLGLLALAVLSCEPPQSVSGLKQPAANFYAQSAYGAPYVDGLFIPVEDLSALSVDSFTTLGHNVRVKRTVFECDPDSELVHFTLHDISQARVRSSGYIDIGARHVFYFYFESRNDPVERMSSFSKSTVVSPSNRPIKVIV